MRKLNNRQKKVVKPPKDFKFIKRQSDKNARKTRKGE